MIILVLLIFIVSNWTKFGSNVFATGGNKIAAKYMGIKVDKIKIICFAICSFFAGFAGVLNVSRFKLADPTVGTGLELEAITAAVIGGILLSGGYGNIIGVVIGSILISTIRSGLIIIGVPGYFYTGVLGIVLVITALINNTIINKTFKREFL
jgi:simple sugar transport system permease protein